MLTRAFRRLIKIGRSDWKGSDRAMLGWAALTGFAAGLLAVLLKRKRIHKHAVHVAIKAKTKAKDVATSL